MDDGDAFVVACPGEEEAGDELGGCRGVDDNLAALDFAIGSHEEWEGSTCRARERFELCTERGEGGNGGGHWSVAGLFIAVEFHCARCECCHGWDEAHDGPGEATVDPAAGELFGWHHVDGGLVNGDGGAKLAQRIDHELGIAADEGLIDG